MKNQIVIVESPYAGDVVENTEYALDCLRDSLDRGESPFASHLLYTSVLDEETERKHGLRAARPFYRVCSKVAVYVDRGISPGMKLGIMRAKRLGKVVEYRKIRT